MTPAHPSLAGDWELFLAGSSFGYLPPPSLRHDHIEQPPGRLLIVTRQVDSNGDNTVRREFPTDGAEVELDVLGRTHRYTAHWEEGALVVDNRWELSGRARWSTDHWRRVGDEIHVERRFRLPGGDVRQRLILRRARDLLKEKSAVEFNRES